MHTLKAATCHGGPAVHDLQIQHMLPCRTATDLLLCFQQLLRVFLVPTARASGRTRSCKKRRLLAVVALVKDLAREHCRLDDATYDGRRLADAALVPRERRPRRAHPVEAAQQVLVAPRVQVVICGRQKKKSISSGQSTAKSGTRTN